MQTWTETTTMTRSTAAPDVNVLVAAFRGDHAHHAPARDWLTAQLHAGQSGARLLLLPMVCASFVRLVTHPRIFDTPASADEAFDFLDALLAQPGCEMPQTGVAWPMFAVLCRGKALSANAVPDAWIAAAARALGTHLITFDRDFARLLEPHEFTRLKPRDPH
jgi:toxin-antitoxin system PIN domain toxin